MTGVELVLHGIEQGERVLTLGQGMKRGGIIVRALGYGARPEVFLATNPLLADLVPYLQEDSLQLVHRRALNAHVHVAPTAHLRCAVEIVVGHIHAASVSHVAVDDDNLPMVALEDVVHKGELDGVVLVDFHPLGTNLRQRLVLQRLVVGHVAECIEQRPHLHSLGGLLIEELEQGTGYGVVAEVEILQMDVVLGFPNGFEHVGKLCLSTLQNLHIVAGSHRHISLVEPFLHERVAPQLLCAYTYGKHQKNGR